MDNIYVNKLIDTEEGDGQYTYLIVTKNNCKELIQECIDTWYDMNNMCDFDEIKSVSDYLKYLKEEKIKLDDRIVIYLEKNSEYEIDTLESAFNFSQQLLEDCGELVNSSTCNIYY